MLFIVTAGQRHACPQAQPLLEAGLELFVPEAVIGDTGYSSGDLREGLEEHEIEAVIPRRSHETADDDYDDLYRERNLIERAFNRLKRFRAVATRYDKLASS